MGLWDGDGVDEWTLRLDDITGLTHVCVCVCVCESMSFQTHTVLFFCTSCSFSYSKRCLL